MWTFVAGAIIGAIGVALCVAYRATQGLIVRAYRDARRLVWNVADRSELKTWYEQEILCASASHLAHHVARNHIRGGIHEARAAAISVRLSELESGRAADLGRREIMAAHHDAAMEVAAKQISMRRAIERMVAPGDSETIRSALDEAMACSSFGLEH